MSIPRPQLPLRQRCGRRPPSRTYRKEMPSVMAATKLRPRMGASGARLEWRTNWTRPHAPVPALVNRRPNCRPSPRTLWRQTAKSQPKQNTIKKLQQTQVPPCNMLFRHVRRRIAPSGDPTLQMLLGKSQQPPMATPAPATA